MRARARRTHDRPVRRSRAVLAAVIAAGGVLAGAAPAAADGSLVPGETQTVVLPVPDGWAADADAVRVVVDGVEQLENDCLEPEKEAGDDCTSDRGELGDNLVATVAWGTGGDDCRPAVDMTSLDIHGFDGTRFESTRFEHVAGVECFVFELSFPHGNSDSLAQSDSLTFGLDAVAEEIPGEVAGTGEPDYVDPSPISSADDGSGTESQDPADLLSGSAAPRANAGGNPAAVDGAAPARSQVGRGTAGQDGRTGTGAPPVHAEAAVHDRGSPGPMADRVGAQVSVGADGVSIETRAAETSIHSLALAWSSLLLGAIALGWFAFVLVRRRRTDAAA
jgi:hypothetical protein